MKTKEQADADWQAYLQSKAPRNEHELQSRVVAYCRSLGMYNVVRERFAAVPNGAFLAGDAKRRADQFMKLRREGLRPGFPDLQFWREGGRMMFLEMKNGKKGVVSPDQKDLHKMLSGDGFTVVIARDYETAVNAIREFYGV